MRWYNYCMTTIAELADMINDATDPDTLTHDLSQFPSARDYIDALIDDNRDNFTDEQMTLASTHRDELIFALALHLLDSLADDTPIFND